MVGLGPGLTTEPVHFLFHFMVFRVVVHDTLDVTLIYDNLLG